MIILGVNNNNDLIYVYTEDKSKIDYLLSAIKNNKIENCVFFKDYMVIIRKEILESISFFMMNIEIQKMQNMQLKSYFQRY